MATVIGTGSNPNEIGVLGESQKADGVRGLSHAPGAGVIGINDGEGQNSGFGVHGISKGTGVAGDSETWMGVYGNSKSTVGGAGVMGEAIGSGVIGTSQTWVGVYGETKSTTGGAGVMGEHKAGGSGVVGISDTGTGVSGESKQGAGVHGRGPTGGFFEGGAEAGVHAVALGSGPAILAKGGGSDNLAGFFDGNLQVTQTIKTIDVIILGADCAEDFDIMSSAPIEPGTVLVIGEGARLEECHQAYDKRVAGIVSGAGEYQPGIVLGKDASRRDRVPLALIGKVFCKVDATFAPVEIGDLLTTSPTRGHAMKAADPFNAFGAVIGKALAPLKEGTSLLPILVALQ